MDSGVSLQNSNDFSQEMPSCPFPLYRITKHTACWWRKGARTTDQRRKASVRVFLLCYRVLVEEKAYSRGLDY